LIDNKLFNILFSSKQFNMCVLIIRVNYLQFVNFNNCLWVGDKLLLANHWTANADLLCVFKILEYDWWSLAGYLFWDGHFDTKSIGSIGSIDHFIFLAHNQIILFFRISHIFLGGLLLGLNFVSKTLLMISLLVNWLIADLHWDYKGFACFYNHLLVVTVLANFFYQHLRKTNHFSCFWTFLVKVQQ